jgi:hypothetical protein
MGIPLIMKQRIGTNMIKALDNTLRENAIQRLKLIKQYLGLGIGGNKVLSVGDLVNIMEA